MPTTFYRETKDGNLMAETLINRFDLGMVSDPRDPRENTCRILTNFDTSSPFRLVPWRDSESGDSSASADQIQNFCIALATSYKLFGLGVISASDSKPRVRFKTLTTGGTTDLSDATWDATSNNSGTGAANFELCHFYKKTGLIYGARASQYIWSYNPGGSAWVDSAKDLGAFTNITQAITHSKDDIMYFGVDNKIIKNDNGSFVTALTLPSHFYVSSVCEDGDFLGIALAPVSGYGESRYIRWDRDSSVQTCSENISFGEGILKIVEQIEGNIIGISISPTINFKSRITFKYYTPNGAVQFAELIDESTGATLLANKQKIGNKLYFLMRIYLNGAMREGIWSAGRADANSPFKIVHESKPNNDTALGNGLLKGFFIVGEYRFISYTTNAGVFGLSKTNDQASYTAYSIWEKRFNTINSKTTKKLVRATVMTEPLPTAGQIVVKYKKDEESSFTEIFTEDTNNSISKTATKTTAGDNLPQYKESDFQIISTGGAVVTGFLIQEEILSKGV